MWNDSAASKISKQNGDKKKPLKCVIIMYTDHDYSIVLGIHTKPPVWECVREV